MTISKRYADILQLVYTILAPSGAGQNLVSSIGGFFYMDAAPVSVAASFYDYIMYAPPASPPDASATWLFYPAMYGCHCCPPLSPYSANSITRGDGQTSQGEQIITTPALLNSSIEGQCWAGTVPQTLLFRTFIGAWVLANEMLKLVVSPGDSVTISYSFSASIVNVKYNIQRGNQQSGILDVLPWTWSGTYDTTLQPGMFTRFFHFLYFPRRSTCSSGCWYVLLTVPWTQSDQVMNAVCAISIYAWKGVICDVKTWVHI